MNKILYVVALSIMIAFIFAPICVYEEEKVEENIDEQIVTEVTEVSEISEREQDMYDEMVRVACIEDKKEWFVEYKKLCEKYSEYLVKQEEIYDVFNENELEKLFRMVESEATGGTFQDKVNVAVTIFNRIKHDDFGSTIDEVITPDQFSPLQDGRYYEAIIAKETILACEYAYIFGIIEHNALYFRTNGNSWAHRNLEEVEVNGDNAHRFYK